MIIKESIFKKKKTVTKIRHFIIEGLGWYGMFAILLAYILVSLSFLDVNNISYILLNITGALGLIIVAWHDKSWQFVALNTVWLIVAIKSLITH